ncbi:MAG: chromate efflux transporter [Deltaproteobacteria bacterium]|nr:chromate efflux transporter [Deltaproteobacteria bacterium]
MTAAGPNAETTLPRLVLELLKLGAMGFGGGMAVIALMERDLVQERKLLGTEEFLHGVGLGQLLGPFAVNTSFFVGHRLFGPTGGVLCAAAFLAPSVLLVIGLSWLYSAFHSIPALQSAIAGVGPVVIALILSAAWSMGKKALRSGPAVALAAAAFGASFLRISPVYVLTAAGVLGLVLGTGRWGGRGTPEKAIAGGSPGPKAGAPSAAAVVPMAVPAVVSTPLGAVALTFLKLGLVFFGGGFVLIPLLHQRLVVDLHWLTSQQFLDGVAISNLTPGPIAVLATFVGYHVQGVVGALVATGALFLPATVLMMILCKGYGRFKEARRAKDFLSGVTPAVAGLVAGAAFALGPGALRGPAAWCLLAVSLLLLIRKNWHPAFVLGVGALLGAGGWV